MLYSIRTPGNPPGSTDKIESAVLVNTQREKKKVSQQHEICNLHPETIPVLYNTLNASISDPTIAEETLPTQKAYFSNQQVKYSRLGGGSINTTRLLSVTQTAM